MTKDGAALNSAIEARERGDAVGAIVHSARALQINPEYEDAFVLFAQYYPASVDGLKKEAEGIAAGKASDPFFNDRLIGVYEKLATIDAALAGLPPKVTNPDTKQSIAIVREPVDYKSKALEARNAAAEAHYAAAEARLPGDSIAAKQEILAEYGRALSLVKPYKDASAKSAQLCYDVAELLSNGTLADRQQALKFYQQANAHSAGFKDSSSRLQVVAYGIGRELEGSGAAESYDKAMEFYTLAAGYQDASARLQVYAASKAIASLSNQAQGSDGELVGAEGGMANPGKLQEQPLGKLNPLQAKVKVVNQFDEMTLFDPGSDVIYIGALIDGKSIADGTWRPITADRAPMTFSIDLANINGRNEAVVEDPTRLSNVQNAINALLAQGARGSVPADAIFVRNDVKSQSHFDMSVGVGYGRGGFSMDSNVDYSKSTSLSRTLIKFTQKYYTLNMDYPKRPSDLFSITGRSPITPAAFGNVSPYYVSSVYYGRTVYFLIESESTSEEVETAFNATMEFAVSNVSGSLDTAKKVFNSKTRIMARVVGGESANANITSLDGIVRFIKSGMDVSKNLGAAKPIGYKLRSVRDNSVARIIKSAETVVPSMGELVIRPAAFRCTSNPDDLKATLSLQAAVNPDNARDYGRFHQLFVTKKEFFHFPVGPAYHDLASKSTPLVVQVGSPADKIVLSADAGDVDELIIGPKTEWAGRKYVEFTVQDLINRSENVRQVMDSGMIVSGKGQSFQIKFDLELK
jgi:hypothetical protein